MRYIPTDKNIIIRPKKQEEQEQTTKAGIILPSQVNHNKSQIAEVISTGEFINKIKPGMTVVYKQYSPDEIQIDGEKHLIIQEDDILVIIEK